MLNCEMYVVQCENMFLSTILMFSILGCLDVW